MENITRPTIQIDDHPREMVLAFDTKALEEMKPRHFASGYEIFKVPTSLFRSLVGNNFLNDVSKALGFSIADHTFNVIKGDALKALDTFANSKTSINGLEANLRQFYRYLAYFTKYSLENNTGLAFDF